jgi:hypothetical protein
MTTYVEIGVVGMSVGDDTHLPSTMVVWAGPIQPAHLWPSFPPQGTKLYVTQEDYGKIPVKKQKCTCQH